MAINLPWKQGDKVLEIGGGTEGGEWFHPNLDIRPGKKVDIVHDFRLPIPLPDESLDGVFSKFSLEHVTLSQLKEHLKDVLRILKPNGYFVAVTANLYEQCKYVINHEFTKDSNYMIFAGSPDYEFNYHHVGFSPDWVGKLFLEAGFSNVIVSPWWEAITDMVVEGKK